jgi:hypothetical protein
MTAALSVVAVLELDSPLGAPFDSSLDSLLCVDSLRLRAGGAMGWRLRW